LKKRIFCMFFAVLLTFSLTSCGNYTAWTANTFDAEIQKMKFSNTVIDENDKYKLEWVGRTCTVSLTDKATGQKWGITPSKDGEATVDEFGMPIKKNPKLESAIIVNYVNDASYVLETAISYTDAVSRGRVRAEKIENGIKVEYYFDSIEIMIPVEYILREDSVAVTVDPNKIQENDKKVASVSIAPYWCSTENNSKDAYLFVPSGSGALVSTDETTQAGINYFSSVYGRDQVMSMNDDVTTEESVRLPVYGAKQGETATCAIIESAADSSNITVNAGSGTIGYSAVYTTFQVRGYNESFISGNVNKQDVYAKSMVTTPLTVGFYPLTGKSANYSGMAAVYKSYLKKNGYLAETKNDIPLSVTFVGGQPVSRSFFGIPYDTLLAATTLNETQSILEDISSRTDAKISAKLLGYGSNGLELSGYVGGFTVNKNLGSQKDLTELNKYCLKNGIDLYFDFDLVKLKGRSSGFSALFDTARNTCFKVTDLYDYNIATRSRITDTKYHLLGRQYLPEGAEKLLKKTKDWDLSGVSLETLTSLSYSDYTDRKSADYYSKANMARDVEKIINKLKEKYLVAAKDANAYAALNSDIIYDAPTGSSKESIFYCDVPFYQMVFKGYVPMTASALNLAADTNRQLLQAVESGCGISYVLTANYDNEFTDSDTYYFFGSKYSDLSDILAETVSSVADYYSAIDGAEITGHSILENGLHVTEFGNGKKVYVNYSDEAVISPLGEVPAMDFMWG
jgi:hypothetical protein